MKRNLWLLAIAQGLFLTNNVTFIAINGLVGLSLAPLGWMATLPVMGYVVGGALSTGLVAKSQSLFGRKTSFHWVCWSVCFRRGLRLCGLQPAVLVTGCRNGSGGLLQRQCPVVPVCGSRIGDILHFKEKAVSLVLAGGLIGAVSGPNLALWTKSMFATPFAGAYLALVFVALLSMLVISSINFPAHVSKNVTNSAKNAGRPLSEIMRQPVLSSPPWPLRLGYGVMNLLMAATPIAMQQCGLQFSDVAFVLEWHVIGMFAPGFFTGHLIKRFGVLQIMGVGVVLNLICILIALSGQDLHQFLIALFLLGLGWNFLFTGSTTLALDTYTPEEKDRAQGAINFFTFAVLALSSFASGALVTTHGWTLLNIGFAFPDIYHGSSTFVACFQA